MSNLTPEKAEALRRPFPPETVGKLPKGGVMLDYVGHAAVTDRLLVVDPEWSWEPMAVDATGLPAIDGAGNLWIRLTICGVTRLGVGDGKNAKEAIGDAIRNAAMRFGVALDLWAKENLVEFEQAVRASHTEAPPDPPAEPPATRRMSRPPRQTPTDEAPPEPASREQITKIQAQFSDLGTATREERLKRVMEIIERPIDSSNKLTKAEASRVIGQLDLDLMGGP
jgi:hypothetical protein